jgi:hypothetical protein
MMIRLAAVVCSLAMLAGCGRAIDGMLMGAVSAPATAVRAQSGAAPMADDPQVLMTRLAAPSRADSVRGDSLARAMRAGIERYRDVREAVRAGYKPFPAAPDTMMRIIHYVHTGRSRREASRLVAGEPGALLFERVSRIPHGAAPTHAPAGDPHAAHAAHAGHGAPSAAAGDSLRLVGAMYTAPVDASLETLHARVPLSMTQWHLHRNVCVPRPVWDKTAWARRDSSGRALFGPGGAIVSEGACDAARGRFLPTVFGWMAHIHVFADDPADVWNAMYGHEHGDAHDHGAHGPHGPH